MALFTPRSDPGRQQRDLEAQLKSKVAARAENAERLQAAEAKLVECRSIVDQAALASDDGKLDVGLQNRRAAEDKLGALKAASIRLASEAADLEKQIAQVVDSRTRSQTAKAIDELIERWESDQAAYMDATLQFEKTSREVSEIVLDAHGTSSFLMSSHQQIPAASAVVLLSLRAYRAEVLAGHARATLPMPDVPAPKLAVVKPPTRSVFALQHLAFIDAVGQLRRHPKMHDVELPVALADEAVRVKAAIEISDPRRKQLHGSFNWLMPELANCVKLGDVPTVAPKSNNVVITASSPFEIVDRGPGYTMRVPVEPLPLAAGARSMPEE